ncbi:MAG: NAD(P)H-hydrate dehydratase [Euryarchaeota archaeon]|nr:NAD(P)H-hydrate dehydratase [Euryarchaeota archaeon]
MVKKYITSKKMRAVDINSEYFGVPRAELMENAGRAVFEVLKERFELGETSFLVVCGTGNNGGDGFVVARHLHEAGAGVRVLLVGAEEDIKTPEAGENFRRIKGEVEIDRYETGKVPGLEADVIVDALLGTGITGTLREPVKSLVYEINRRDAFKLSVDVPTGLDADTGEDHGCVDADLVVTFHRMKKGLEGYDTVVKDIGIPPEAESHVGPGDLIVNLGRRKADSHKGDHGRVLVIGGSEEYLGAPVLAALAALRSGADLVYLMTPESNFDAARSISPDLIVRKYPKDLAGRKDAQAILDLAALCHAVVIGPGMGRDRKSDAGVAKLLERMDRPVVIDADAIKALKGRLDILKKMDAVITPHSREFQELTDKKLPAEAEARREMVLNTSEALSTVILLKGPVDIIAGGGEVRLNATGNPGMTVGGTGDVLAGVTAGFIAQGMDSFHAACCAAFLCGAAGDELYQVKGYAFSAGDLVEELPYTLKDVMDF